MDIAPDVISGLGEPSTAQCQHIRAVSPRRVTAIGGNVGAVVLMQIRETIAVLIDLPS